MSGPARRGLAAEVLLLAAIVAAPWPYGGATDVARYALCALVLVGASLLASARPEIARTTRVLAGAAGLLPAWGAVQALAGRGAGWPASAEAVLVLGASMAVLVSWAVRAQDRAATDRLLWALLAVGAAQGAFGIVQAALDPLRVYGRSSALVTAPFGSFVNHNHFAGFVEMCAVLAAGLATARARRDGASSPTLALAGLALGLVLAHLASGSRGGLVALVGGLALLAAAHAWRAGSSRRSMAWALGGGLVALVALGLVLAPASARSRLATLVSASSDPSAGYRVEAARATLRLLAAHPIAGAGLGAFPDAVTAFKQVHGEVRLTHAESDALELAAETGIVGIALFALLAWAWWRALDERLRRGRDPLRRDVAIAAACAAGTGLLHALFDFGLRLPALAFACAALAGVAAAPPRDSVTARVPAAARTAITAMLLGLALASGWRALGARALDAALRESDPTLRTAALGPVLARHPYLAEAWRERAAAVGRLSAAGALHPARADRARSDLARALALRPLWAEAWSDAAFLHRARGDDGACRAALERSRALDPTHLPMGMRNAELVFRLDGPRAAVLEIARVQRLNPGWSLDDARRRAERFTADPAALALLTSPK